MQLHLLLCIRVILRPAEKTAPTVMTEAQATELSAEIVMMSADTETAAAMIAVVMTTEDTAEATDVTDAALIVLETEKIEETDVILIAEKEEERDAALATQTEETADTILTDLMTGEVAATADATEAREAIIRRRYSAAHTALRC